MRLRVDESELFEEAENRFRQCVDYYGRAYDHWHEDWKFGHADARNGYQWDADMAKSRAIDGVVSLTINKTRQHCLQVINALTQADTSIKFTAVSNEATEKAAEAMEGIVRHIEYVSNARSIYRRAIEQQVYGGLGYWRVITDYADGETQDQDIFLRSVPDPTRVYLDPDTTEPDGSDARFAFIFDQIPVAEFERLYPDATTDKDTFGVMWSGAQNERVVTIVEYFRKVTRRERVFFLDTGKAAYSSDLPAEMRQMLRDNDTPSRMVETHEIQWFKCVGREVLEKTIWPGDYIPIVPVFGEVTKIDDIFDSAGHVRAMIDAQRQYNYMRSAATQAIGLQSKTPFIGPVEAISGLETYWESANRANYAILPYNGYDSQGRPIAPPARAPAPMMPQAYIAGTEAAAMDMQMVSGQFEAAMGEPSNERSGVAIQQRQMAGEQGADHFKQAFEMALRLTGKILLNLIPRIYTAKRVLRILAVDGKQSRLVVDPQAQAAFQEAENVAENEAQSILNPNVGRYEVEADIGPGFLTRRQQAFAFAESILTKAPEWAPVIGDLLLKEAPFPGADEMAERLRRMVPPQALGGPSPELLQMQQEMHAMHQAMTEMVQRAAEEKLRRTSTEQQKGIDAYKAETDRIETLKEIAPAILLPLVQQVVAEALRQPPPPEPSAQQLGMEPLASG